MSVDGSDIAVMHQSAWLNSCKDVKAAVYRYQLDLVSYGTRNSEAEVFGSVTCGCPTNLNENVMKIERDSYVAFLPQVGGH